MDFELNHIDKLVEQTGDKPDSLIPILLSIQKQYNFLPEEALKRICELTSITHAEITGVATFYSQFRLQPAGEHFLNICTGTACHVKGADRILQTLSSQLDLKPGEDTDQERKFTVRKVACLGCCTLAPVVQIDETTYGHVAANVIPGMLEDYLENKHNGVASDRAINPIERTKAAGEIRVGLGSCCVAGGSHQVKISIEQTLEEINLSVPLKDVGCVGMCHRTPLIEIIKPGEEPAFYGNVTSEAVPQIIRNHFKPPGLWQRTHNSIVNMFENLILTDETELQLERYNLNVREGAVADFLNCQVHIATEHSGAMSPLDLKEYNSLHGFVALRKILTKNDSEWTIETIKQSGLRGRGGGGFPTGKKFEIVASTNSKTKYVICNGDEGDPGAFMDRMLLESYPYRIIEGLIIAAMAVGAEEGFFYIRAEYPLAVERITLAIEECYRHGILGDSVLGSNKKFNLSIREGAGAFVCGEETALIKSIEGVRGMPEIRPPYPAVSGLWDKPTLVNNVETLAMIPWIIRNGADKFSSYGTKSSKGTKVFALAGKIAGGGLIEVPMGITINEIVYQIGGGIANGKKFKAVQVGGPSGGCIPAELGNTPIDYEALGEVGAMMGSGGLLVMDEDDCMVDIARYFLSFTQNQSCGKCTFCRVGTRRMLDIMDRICLGKGTQHDLDNLKSLSSQVKMGSICGLGTTAPNPVMTTLKYFESEYQEHLAGRCPTKKCKDLITYHILDNCVGCTICSQHCPVDAIPHVPYSIHVIDQDLCIKCDTCIQVCPEDSVEILS